MACQPPRLATWIRHSNSFCTVARDFGLAAGVNEDFANPAGRVGDFNDAMIALRLVLQLERLPCLPQ
jgi:hypothetical protein